MKLIVKFYAPENNGRLMLPDLSSGIYRPHLIIKDDAEATYLGVQFSDYLGELVFGEDCEATVKCLYDKINYSGLEPGVAFFIREGGKTVGEGHVKSL